MPLAERARLPALLSLLLALGLAACATPPEPLVVSEVAEAAAPDDPVIEPNYPAQSLSEDMLLRFLVGDIALQRGNTQLASQAWAELAQKSSDVRVARRATEVAIAAGQLNQALDACARWLDAEPSAAEARQIMVSLLIRANRLDDARPHLQALLAMQPKEAAPFLMQLHRLWDKQTDRKAALKLTQELAAGYDGLPEAHFALALAYANADLKASALTELDRADALRPAWEPSLLYRAQLLEDQPDAQRAFLEKAVRAAPKSAELQNALARSYAEAKRYPEAAAAYDKAQAITPGDLESLVGAGLIAIELRQFDKANAQLSAAVAKAPRQTRNLYYYLGVVAEEQQRWADAARWYEGAEGELKTMADRHLVRVYAKLDRLADAQALIARMPTDSAEARNEKAQTEAQLWRETKDYVRAYAVLSDALKVNPDSAELLYDRSLIADLMNDLGRAEADLRRYNELKPASAMGLNALGYTLANRSTRLEEAQRYLEQAIALEPENPVIIDSLGWLRYRQGRLAEARELLIKAHAKLPDPEIAAHLAEVLWQLGRKDEARKVFAEAQQLDPRSDALRETSQRLGM
ncbi:tetratricopeptide repeat protein [Chitinolyticbacter albus]|uniref:tetratricopeptide repeat protein n=1 Tax=Chitinolyticbacter albus TaxID=2961951 RepID=UPI00210DDAB7|nr:tetratricopeptide repeat protein [Chitinolyticbacter albus]